ncbi:Crp/Fnr family transcriptional regulator [Chitinophaga sancti]|uniref:Crp/Fnr family transcriptional regulator n=1 Tax=Chitinophaga sancti TaxID=1004 RepID=A0A1K1R2Q6_9BACT|nr:Crp/Fnr family transcriptional regulator [Chitinophaga sancti]WQD64325.1 Crp/Fnr family transcriptional regulator [Chitinophaga sancti]WQG90051.1 Crp/Fnr family transcriptional regulator [Chitinophaga sancti]SFW66408.1 cAMP-binding domain of CRP or a regulatory subunit of cAMP-dependent protein kinases [Chitinophaga sancti]
MFEALDEFVSKYIRLTAEETEIFHSLLEYRKVKKKHFLLREGEICQFEAFILKGCIRTYYVDKSGTETILNFAVEGWWVSDLSSFSEQTPSTQNIETLEDSELLVINYENKKILFDVIPAFEKVFRILVQRSLGVLQQRFYAGISQTAEERYLAFIEKYPQVVQRVPQHQIARYIGVSPEFLSKVRSTLYKKP